MNHFEGTPTFFRILFFHIMGGGEVKCSRQDTLSQFFSLLFSDHFDSLVSDN